jgi:hypothetical protein
MISLLFNIVRKSVHFAKFNLICPTKQNAQPRTVERKTMVVQKKQFRYLLYTGVLEWLGIGDVSRRIPSISIATKQKA